jgi:hypothetical protein
MRWEHNPPQIGDFRQKRGFLLFPRTIEHETRWLERAVRLQRFQRYVTYAGFTVLGWFDVKWINDVPIGPSGGGGLK